MLFLEMFTYPFMVRALIAGALITLCASLLGVSLVLKRYSMIGVGLSYVGFGSLSLAVALKISPVQFSMPIVIIAALLLLRTNKDSSIKPDALIAMVSCISLSFGVMVTAMTTGLNIDVCTYLFGSILAMKKFDVYMSILLSAIVICVYLYYYKKIFLITFDEEFASAKGENIRAGGCGPGQAVRQPRRRRHDAVDRRSRGGHLFYSRCRIDYYSRCFNSPERRK